MSLTDVAARQAKARATAYKLSDSGGLYLQVTANGSKIWRLKYRYLGKEKLLTFGPYPLVSIAEARDQRDAAKKLLLATIDPGEQKKQERRSLVDASAQTFGVIAEEFIRHQEADGKAKATVTKARWFLQDLASPLRDRPIRLITSPEVLGLLRTIEARGIRESSRRCKSSIGRVFRYAISSGRASDDPTASLKGVLLAPKVRHQPAIIDPKAVGKLLLAINHLDGSPVVKAALQFLALCFPRPGELRHAEWAEFDFDGAKWTIPASRMKMRQPHAIPLSKQALELLLSMREISGKGRLVFPGVRNHNQPLSENTMNVALRRLGYTEDQVTAHGFRTTASTLLNESGLWNPDAIERALAHRDGNSVRKAYARGEYWDERVRMAQWWADYLGQLKLLSN